MVVMKINKAFCLVFGILMMCSCKAYAVNNIVKDSFDTLPSEYQISAKGEASVGIKKEDDGNSVLELKGYGKNSALAERTVSLDGSEKVYMDLDYKRETNNDTLFRIQVWYSSKTKRPLIYYITTNNINACGQNIPISSYGLNTWLKLRTIIDFENKKFDLYINNELVCSGRNFNQDAENIGYVQFQIDANNSAEEFTYCFIDNFNIFSINNQLLDKYLSDKKKELESNYDVGTDVNQYSPTKYIMAADRISEIEKIAENPLNESEQTEYINELQGYFDLIDNSQFHGSEDADSVARIPNDIRSCMELQYSTTADSEIVIPLAAETIDNFNELYQECTYSWQMLKGDRENIILSENKLFVQPGTQCNVVLRVTSADMYRDIELFLHDSNSIEVKDIKAEKGSVIISGSVNLTVDADITLAVKGETFYVSENIALNENNTFVCKFDIGSGAKTQDITITAEGEYLLPVEIYDVYIGDDIESVVLSFINDSDIDILGHNIEKYMSGINVDKSAFSEHRNDYLEKVIKGQPYASLSDVNSKLSYINFEIRFSDGNRESIESLIEDNKDILCAKGFSYEKYEKLSKNNKKLFLVEILNIKSDSTESICARMNDVLSKYEEPKQENNNYNGGSNSGGSSGGYKITPKPGADNDNNSSNDDKKDENQPKLFEDINECKWARDAIISLQSKGIIEGDGNNYILPNNILTRAEFAKILVTAFSIEGSSTYEKSEDDEWWNPYVNKGISAGIIKGDENGNFNPDDALSREDMAVLLYRTIVNRKIELYSKEEVKDFFDKADISDYAFEAIGTLQEAGIVNGMGENMFAPKDKVTRAQAIQAVNNILVMWEVK